MTRNLLVAVFRLDVSDLRLTSGVHSDVGCDQSSLLPGV
jgi:hypothetical protein